MTPLHAMGSEETTDTGWGWRRISMLVSIAIAAAAAAAWYADRTEEARWAASATTDASPGMARSASSPSGTIGASGFPSVPAAPTADGNAVDRVIAQTAAQAGSPGWPFWEFQFRQPIAPRDPPLTPLPWRIIGASQAAGQWSLIVIRQGQAAPSYLNVGDTLAGGYRIVAIDEQDVTLVKDRRTLMLSYLNSR